MSAGRWAALARAAAREAQGRGSPVLLCGGTGLYARAFAGGLVEGIAADAGLRSELRERATVELRAELERVDPAAAARIHPNDRARIERALEVTRLGGRPLSEQHARHRFGDAPFELHWLGLTLERDALWQRLRARVEWMFEEGLVEEVRGLHGAGYGPELHPLRSIGYREVGQLLTGRLTEAEAREAIFIATRRYAKRQRTWFGAQPGLEWRDASRPEAILEDALRWLGG
jgi:tRNA dimethylallyltransferase